MHIEIWDTFTNLMNEVCHDVEVEPNLQPLQGESFVNNQTTNEDEAKLDIQANELWVHKLAALSLTKFFYPSCQNVAKTAYRLKKISRNKGTANISKIKF